MGALPSFFMGWVRLRPFFDFWSIVMKKRSSSLAHGAMIAALYAALSYLQNVIFPGSASQMIQFRVAESLNVLAFFTPAAIPGLSIGCAVFNLAFAAALPLDILIGTAATALSAWAMWLLRHRPWLGLWMPAVFNGALVGWELSFFMGGGFWLNCGCVALGEALVMLTLGNLLRLTLLKHRSRFSF